MTAFVRAVGFVVVHASIVALYLGWLSDALPPLQGEPPDLVVTPVVTIAIVAFALLHPVVTRQETHTARLVSLCIAAFASMVAYAGFLAARVEAPSPLAFGVLVLVFEMLYGAPLLLAVALSAKLTSPLLIARPARGWE